MTARRPRASRRASRSLAAPRGGGGQPFIVITGLSGSGKSQAIRALEDLGYFCVDNLPTTLIPTLARLSLRAGGDIERVAIVVDVREGEFLSSFPRVFRKLRTMPRLNPILIFLESTDASLVRRFSETRRPHPLAPDRSVREGIRDERARLTPIRDLADEIVDTSDMTVHELRHFFMGLSRDRAGARLVVTLLSFGFKHGVPPNMSVSSSTPSSPRTRAIACAISSRASFTSSCQPMETAVNCGRSPTIISAALTSSVASCPCVTTTTPIIAASSGRRRVTFDQAWARSRCRTRTRASPSSARARRARSAIITDRWRPPVHPIAMVR